MGQKFESNESISKQDFEKNTNVSERIIFIRVMCSDLFT